MPRRPSRTGRRRLPSLLLSGLLAGCVPDLQARWDACQAAVEAGAAAERVGDYARARERYEAASRLDTADPVPLRYLGELHRHHTGDWDRAEACFRQVLALTSDGSDPLSRAVALHGLGKMTVWANRFEEGLALMRESLAAHPTALCCRNLAVYWIGEARPDLWRPYAAQALELEPDDPYNLVFHAVTLAVEGRHAEAKALAASVPFSLDQSYNRASIAALRGDLDEAIVHLRRQFEDFETTDAVRAREMKEARSDLTLKPLFVRPEFWELTKLADAPGLPPVVAPGGMRVKAP